MTYTRQSSDPIIHLTGYNESLIKKPPLSLYDTKIRWLALLLACLAGIGNYFSVDLPQALQTIIMRDMKVTVLEFNMVDTVYSIPNIILPFFGGLWLTDWE